MKKSLFLAPLLLLATACSSDQPDSPQGGNEGNTPAITDEFTITSEELAAAASTRGFDYAFLKGVVGDNPGENVIVSPFSAQYALSMLANCIDEVSAAQITEALGCDDLASLNSFNGKYLNSVGDLDTRTTVNIANSLWYINTLTLNSKFSDLLTDTYRADKFARDFNDKNVADEINSWCANKTNGLINNIIEKINSDRFVMLINALYFKGAWTEPFEEERVEMRPFYGEKGNSVIHMMTAMRTIPYLAKDNYQAVKLTFGNESFAATFILPDENIAIDDFIAGFDYEAFTNMSFNTEKVSLMLPKCKLMPEKYDLDKTLSALGIRNIFSGAGTDIFTEPLSFKAKIEQKSTIEFSEKGAEASSVTTVGMDAFSNGGEDQFIPVTFTRPYLFFLTETKSGICLMAGKVADIPSVK
ncbi:MAG: serpin family protein [Bacteroidales bacterium]|nr:serpin family protein [Bacteroidales bacterium]